MATEIREVTVTTMAYTSGGVSRHTIAKGTQIEGYGQDKKYFCAVALTDPVMKVGWYIALADTKVVTPAEPEPDPEPPGPEPEPPGGIEYINITTFYANGDVEMEPYVPLAT